ncbi:cation:proton antiporter domain-containing protein [Hyphobacterium marinum]|uniref:Cation:proton antiporter n=1 Tax=Hyphobacterium marinum TaxID=3116574 RepID=A0ABU7LX96_9PROT|nr:cation:proton antiporter [Hyphobacterium sp. Y6023]MEE2566172.1 cation:proton antiporter [Hyphobacterium sp. Y6023]
MDSFLFQAFIYLTAAVIAVPIAKRLGLGSVLGYLIAGVVIGPVAGLVGSETEDLQHFAEFGVVMMLFLVGLELEPKNLWDMRRRLVGLGGLQVVLSAALITGGAMAMGLTWSVALAIGLMFSLSSTAIVLQTLGEKDLTKTEGGQASFSVLLFQDIAVIPMLAFLPLLAMPELMGGGAEDLAHAAADPHGAASDHGEGGGHGASLSLVDQLPGWAYGPVVLAAIAAVVLGGHFLSRPLFGFIARSKLREMFTATALFLVIAIALLMTLVGLSPALGTFLAGVVLANSEYRHELESDIEPFKGLLLGLFFITVGAGVNFDVLFGDFATIAGLTAGLIAIKAAVLFGLAMVFGLPRRDRWLMTLGLAQAGEFGFVLLSFTIQNGIIPDDLRQTLSLVVALSMLLTPVLFIVYDQLIAKRMVAGRDTGSDTIDTQGTTIIAGHGRFGQIINRMLRAAGRETVVIELRSDFVENVRKLGIKTFYGDATRPDLLHAAGLMRAKQMVIAIDDKDEITELVKFVRRERPDIHIVARAKDRHHVYQLYAAGADDMIRETFDSAVRAGRSALIGLGEHPFEAEKAARYFVRHDRETLLKLANAWKEGVSIWENAEYLDIARRQNELMEQTMRSDRDPRTDNAIDRAWAPPPVRPEEEAKTD